MPIPTISQLFSPLPSGVSPGVTPLNVPSSSWLFNELSNGNALSLPVSAWQSGGVAWTELMITAVGMAVSDANVSLHAQAAFLDFCATGTVTFPNPANPNAANIVVPVTPDPSIPSQNPTGSLGWLDVLADSRYNVQRNLATFAAGNLLFVNTTGSSLGSFPTGTFHTANGFTGATYNNSSSFTGSASTVIGGTVTNATPSNPVVITTSAANGLTINSTVTLYFKGISVLPDGFYSAFVSDGTHLILLTQTGTGSYTGAAGRVYQPTSLAFQADQIGPASNASPGQINTLVSSFPGVFVTNPLAFAGSPYESNPALASRCRAKLGSLSVNGPKGAYNYFALTSSQILAAQTPSKTLTSAITKEVDGSNLATGTVTVVVANASGPVAGIAQLGITGATNASPIVLQVSSTAALATGMVGQVQGVQGNTAANGYWTMTVVDGAHVSLNGSTGNGAYTVGGFIEAGDVGLVDSVIQAYAVPNGVTAFTQSAAALNVTITGTVYVPLAFLADYGTNPTSNKGTVALTTYLSGLPIGGIVNVDGAASGVIPYSEIIETIAKAGNSAGNEYTLSVSNVLVNGAAADLAMTSTQVAVPTSLSITVQGV